MFLFVSGFMFGTQVLDKDGISAGAVMSEMASYLYSNGLTVTQKLQELYVKYILLSSFTFSYGLNFEDFTHLTYLQNL